MKYRHEYRLLSSDVDMYRRLRLSRLFTLLQEAAIAHTEQLGMGRAKTLDKGILWALAMRRIRVNRLPEYDERIELTSWPGETMHVLFPRFSRLTGEGGEVLAEGSALWILMDAERRERVFPDEAGIHVPGMGAEGIPLPRALKAPTVESVPFRVPYSWCDLNGHMNNAHLPDLAEDIMPDELRGRAVRQIEAEYLAEAMPGDLVQLRGASDGNLFSLAVEKEKPLFRLRLEYAQMVTE